MTEVKKPSDVPLGPHYAVVEYEERQEHDGWDEKEGGGYHTVLVAKHMVTTERSKWEAYLAKLEEPKYGYGSRQAQYVAFEVKGLAKVERKVTVSVGIG